MGSTAGTTQGAAQKPAAGADWMAAAGVIQGFGQVGGAFAQSNAYQAQGNYESYLAEVNSKLLGQQFQETIKKGNEESSAYSKKVKGLVGSQRTALAAQGIDIGSGSAADIQKETREMGAEDAMRIKNNAYQEAFGYKVQSINTAAQGRFTSSTAGFNSRQSLLAGGLSAASSFAGSYGEYKKRS
jgi:hypothetical protein